MSGAHLRVPMRIVLQRTVATARNFFITGAFPAVLFLFIIRKKWAIADPTFNPVITDDSAAFRPTGRTGDGKGA